MKHDQNSWQAIISLEQLLPGKSREMYALHRIEVPGGWIYVTNNGDNGLSSCYVPKGE